MTFGQLICWKLTSCRICERRVVRTRVDRLVIAIKDIEVAAKRCSELLGISF